MLILTQMQMYVQAFGYIKSQCSLSILHYHAVSEFFPVIYFDIYIIKQSKHAWPEMRARGRGEGEWEEGFSVR